VVPLVQTILLSGIDAQDTGATEVGTGAALDVEEDITIVEVDVEVAVVDDDEEDTGAGGGAEIPHAGSDGNTQALPQQTVPSPHLKGGENGAVEATIKNYQ
jgi:hypothetical protein